MLPLTTNEKERSMFTTTQTTTTKEQIKSLMNVTLLNCMGDDLTVVNAARVSFANTSYGLEKRDVKLIEYLAKHNHWTPFGHVQFSFRVKAPIFVARQLAKHQVGLVWNEVSRRYVKDDPEFFTPDMWRGTAANVKQGSSDESVYDPEYCSDTLEDLHTAALHAYDSLLEEGVAPEQARMVLPLSMYTEWVWTGSLAAFMRVVNLRTHPTAQEEVKVVARKIGSYIKQACPHSYEALKVEENI